MEEIQTITTKALTDKLQGALGQIIKNQGEMTEFALAALFAGGHVLLEGVPGLGKTLWVKVLSQLLDIPFNRVQFTSDLMPSDILGVNIYNQQTQAFELKQGPLFTQLFLADEINRTPPKTQSALLEVMEEKSITIDGKKYTIRDPFMVIATQNPLEYEGTYPLPEALVDRFLMKLVIHYPGLAAERDILAMYDAGFSTKNIQLSPICSVEDIYACQREIAKVTIDDLIVTYILSMVETTRRLQVVETGASPRASIALLLASKAIAAMRGRDFVIPDDVRELALPILGHRFRLRPEAEIDGISPADIVCDILKQVKAPR